MEFKEMYNLIEDYHAALGQRRTYDTMEQRVQSVRNLSLAVMMELAELVDSTPWKPWRPMEDQGFDRDNAAREVIDIMFFLVAICEDLNITAEQLETKFAAVLHNNLLRLENGYSKKMGGGDTSDASTRTSVIWPDHSDGPI